MPFVEMSAPGTSRHDTLEDKFAFWTQCGQTPGSPKALAANRRIHENEIKYARGSAAHDSRRIDCTVHPNVVDRPDCSTGGSGGDLETGEQQENEHRYQHDDGFVRTQSARLHHVRQ